MNLRWIGQSGYILTTATTEVIIDPYLSDVVNRVAARPRMVQAPIRPQDIRADAVICTHNHLDHLDPDAVSEMPPDTRFITTHEGVEKLKTLQRYNATALAIGDSITVGDIHLTAVFANHTVEAFGLLVEAEGTRLYFSGDTLFDEKLFAVAQYHPDITCICINGKLGNMDVTEAITVAKKIGAATNIPHHYGMFASNTEDPQKFTQHIQGGYALKFNTVYTIKEGMLYD